MFAALRLNRIYRFTALLALWVMLFPALVPLFHHPTMDAEPPCHMASMGGHPSAPDSEKSKPSCPICQSLHQLAQGFVAPVLPDFAALSFAADQFRPDFTARVVYTALTSAWPRAPPVFA